MLFFLLKLSNKEHVYIDVTRTCIYVHSLYIHVYINAGPLPFKSQTIAYIMKRSAIYIKVQSKYTCVGSSACIIYYSKFNRNIHS